MKNEISEVQIEDFLRGGAKVRGGQAIKLGQNGWPDDVVALPGARIGFLELKKPGEEPDRLQWDRIGTLRSLGFIAEYANSFAMVEAFLKRVNGERF